MERLIQQLPGTYVERYVEEILTPDRVNLRVRLRTAAGHLLEVHEAVLAVGDALVHLDYRYHCQGEQGRLRFRYDSTPHFPSLSSFPHHKHLTSGEAIASERPELAAVLGEAIQAPDVGKGC